MPLGLSDQDEAQILALYEEVFNHRSFTGRSGTFYKYEGLGCIYWHMVSMLLPGSSTNPFLLHSTLSRIVRC